MKNFRIGLFIASFIFTASAFARTQMDFEKTSMKELKLLNPPFSCKVEIGHRSYLGGGQYLTDSLYVVGETSYGKIVLSEHYNFIRRVFYAPEYDVYRSSPITKAIAYQQLGEYQALGICAR